MKPYKQFLKESMEYQLDEAKYKRLAASKLKSGDIIQRNVTKPSDLEDTWLKVIKVNDLGKDIEITTTPVSLKDGDTKELGNSTTEKVLPRMVFIKKS